MSNLIHAAVDVRMPRSGLVWIIEPTSSSAVMSLPPECFGRYCTLLSDGSDSVIVTGATPTGLAADEALAATAPTAADTDAFVTTLATSPSPVVLSGLGLSGTVGASAIANGRGAIVSVTAGNHAHHVACDVWIDGLRWTNGDPVSAKVSIPSGGNGTFYGVELYRQGVQPTRIDDGFAPHLKQVTSVRIPPQGGTNGSWLVGVHTITAPATNGALVLPGGVAVPFRPTADAPFMAYASTSTPKLILAVA